MDWTPRVGEVVPYSFVWAHESELGEDSGRKLRPCVIVIAVQRIDDETWRVAVAPITTRDSPDRALVVLPSTIKRHLGLDERPSWIVCDELNHFEWPGFDLGVTPARKRSYGMVPPSLLKTVQVAIVTARRRGALKITNRD
ncbi:MAG TPA: growth inhibitor PemK [Candidatus Binatia bacterium]|nr:growth inhibitor PemK [Candidatus Binatia bacterium]